MKAAEDAIDEKIRKAVETSTRIASVGKTARGCSEQTKVFRTAIDTISKSFGVFSRTLAILLVLFIIHQIFIWVDQNPENAFNRAAFAFEVAELTWDTSSVMYNGLIDIFNAGVVPVWNSLAFYAVEPLVVLTLEIFSLIFTKQHWQGVIAEEDFPYTGFDCAKDIRTAQWCGAHASARATPLCVWRRPPPTRAAQVGTNFTRRAFSRPTTRPATPIRRKPTCVAASLMPTTRSKTTPLASTPRVGSASSATAISSYRPSTRPTSPPRSTTS